MQAVRVHEGNELRYETVPDPQPGAGEALVELHAAALNRRDLLVCTGTYPFPLPLVPGSDGAGVRRDTGEEVVVFPGLGWGEREDAPAPGFGVLGGPSDGTYAELVAPRSRTSSRSRPASPGPRRPPSRLRRSPRIAGSSPAAGCTRVRPSSSWEQAAASRPSPYRWRCRRERACW